MKILTGFDPVPELNFKKSLGKESSEELGNPGCGWYHIYTFRIPSDCELWDSSPGEQLALVLIDIGSFRGRELSEDALLCIRRIFDFFHSLGKQMILRFAYDTEGRGMEREPSSISLVKRHMEQVGGLLGEYARDILVLQGIFVGSWGEMHSSKYLGAGQMSELANTLYFAAAGRCHLSVRTPAQLRTITEHRNTAPALKQGLGLYNDGIFGSETDLGTYGSESRQKTKDTDPWKRAEELEWQAQHMEYVPNGGEALWGKDPVGYRQAVADMQKMHLSYLNSVYHPEILAYWKKQRVTQHGVWSGVSGFDYIGRHLGYRFVVRDVRVSKKYELCSKGCHASQASLLIRIENCGFAGLREEAECFLLIEQGSGKEISVTLPQADPRSWKSGESSVIRAPFPRFKEVFEEGMLFLQLKRKRDGKILRFANEGAEEKVLLGRISVGGRK